MKVSPVSQLSFQISPQAYALHLHRTYSNPVFVESRRRPRPYHHYRSAIMELANGTRTERNYEDDKHLTSSEGSSDSTNSEVISAEVNPVSFDIFPHLETLKQAVASTNQNTIIDPDLRDSTFQNSKPGGDDHVLHPPNRFCNPWIEDTDEQHNQSTVISPCYSPMTAPQSPPQLQSPLPSPKSPSRMKLLCSFGGRIMARPVDGKLRYCGGETRIVSFPRGINYCELMSKMSHLYNTPVMLKYQLPGEDMDALVSVSSDDDLQNLLDEYDKLESSGSTSWLRLFFFSSPAECEILECSMSPGAEDSMNDEVQRYIEAINGIPERFSDIHIDHGNTNDVAFQYHTETRDRNSTNASRTLPAGLSYSPRPLLRVSSASPSSPSSPLSVPRQLHLKTHMADGFPREWPNITSPPNGMDISSPETIHDVFVDKSNTQRCDHQSTRAHELQIPRCESKFVVSPGALYFADHKNHNHGATAGAHDTWTDRLLNQPGRIMNPQCHCVDCLKLKHGIQASTPISCQTYNEEEYSRAETRRYCPPVPMCNQIHVGALSTYHQECHGRAMKGGAICDCSCQGQVSSHFSQGQGQVSSHFSQGLPQIYPHNPNMANMYTVGSNPSSPLSVIHSGMCNCCHQHSQVHRGINVSLGDSHSRRSPQFVEQSPRKNISSRFCDGNSHHIDAMGWQQQTGNAKGLEFEKQEQMMISTKQTLEKDMLEYQLGDKQPDFSLPLNSLEEKDQYNCHATEYHEDKAPFLESIMGYPAFTEHSDFLDQNSNEKVKVESGVDFSDAEPFQDLLNDIEAGQQVEDLNFNSRKWSEELEFLIGNVSDDIHPTKYLTELTFPQESSIGAVNGTNACADSRSLTSTVALAGSLSGPPFDPNPWFESVASVANNENPFNYNQSENPFKNNTDGLPENPFNNNQAGSSENPFTSNSTAVSPVVDRLTMPLNMLQNYENYDSAMNEGSTCIGSNMQSGPANNLQEMNVNNFQDMKGSRAETLPSSPNRNTKDQSILQEVFGSSLAKDNADAPEEQNQHSLGTLSFTNFEGSSITLASPIYDQSPTRSLNADNFSFERNKQSHCAVKEPAKDAASEMNLRGSILTNKRENANIQECINKGLEDGLLQKDAGLKSEESISFVVSSSKHWSTDTGAAPVTQNSTTNGTHCEGNENNKEIQDPVLVAEKEAIARGLQIIKNSDLEELKELGSGTYGTVYHGKWKGSDVAIKRIKASCFEGRPSVKQRLVSDFWREAAMLAQLHHPNVVAFYGVVPDGPGGTLATVTEYMVNGSLKQVLVKKDRTIDRKKRLLIAMDAAFGMEYLHSKNIVHFDLKSENLLVNMRDAHRPICKVGDFGLSKVKHNTLVSGGIRGTLPWMAPELLSERSNMVTEKIDVYSFGIVMWELLTGEEPYANMHCGTIIGGIVNNTLRPSIPTWCDPNWKMLMEKCWSDNPQDRPTFSEVASELRAIASSMNIK